MTTKVSKRTRTIAAKLLDDMCANMELLKCFDDGHVDEVAASLQELLDDEGPDGWSEGTKKLVARANELREKTAQSVRANRAYYKRQQELYESWKAARAVVITMRGTVGELDAFRAWLKVDDEMNVGKAADRFEADEKWSDAVRKAHTALADDAGLHLMLPSEDDK